MTDDHPFDTPAWDSPADARLDPWCIVPLPSGDEILFGFALWHPLTDGLSWMTSSRIVALDGSYSRAQTESGRRYELGRQINAEQVQDEGEEALIAFELLVGPGSAEDFGMPSPLGDPEVDRLWVVCCKVARHLELSPPPRVLPAIRTFINAHAEAYLRHRREKAARLGRTASLDEEE